MSIRNLFNTQTRTFPVTTDGQVLVTVKTSAFGINATVYTQSHKPLKSFEGRNSQDRATAWARTYANQSGYTLLPF